MVAFVKTSIQKTAVSLCAGILFASCATINPIRVPSTDSNNPKYQEGLHFYEMRPFIEVLKPFPIWSQSIIVNAQVSADGRYIVLPETYANVTAAFQQFFPPSQAAPPAGQIPIQAVAVVPKGDVGAQAQGADTNVPGSGDTGSGNNAASSAPPPAGTASVSYQVKADGTPIVPVSDLFSIIFLPDYEREYVVDMSSHFGSKKVGITVSPGGGLLAYNASVDNSQIVGPLVDVYKNLVAAGGALAAAAINPRGAAASQISKVASAQGADTVVGTKALSAGSTISVRLTRVRYAIPGIYPIRKPGEDQFYFDADGNPKTQDAKTAGVMYTVKYAYYDEPVVEALVDPSSLMTSQSGSSGDQTQKPSDNAASACSASKMLPATKATYEGLKTTIQGLVTGLTLLKSPAPSAKTDPTNKSCVSELDISATLNSMPYKDTDATATKAFQQIYSGTALVFK